MKKLLFLLIPLFIGSCQIDNSNEDVTQTIVKDGAIEVEMSTRHIVGYDVLTTVQRVWVKQQLVKTIIKNDTIPDLGVSSQYGSTSEGNDTLVILPRDYEFYITVK